jgi:hypothetical protein
MLSPPRNADDHVAVADARAAHRAEAVDRRLVQPDQALAFLVDLVLVADGPERQRFGDRIEKRLERSRCGPCGACSIEKLSDALHDKAREDQRETDALHHSAAAVALVSPRHDRSSVQTVGLSKGKLQWKRTIAPIAPRTAAARLIHCPGVIVAIMRSPAHLSRPAEPIAEP